MNRSIRLATVGLAAAIGSLGMGAAAGAAAGTGTSTGTGFTTPGATPPPPPLGIKVVTRAPEKSTTCEGNGSCADLKAACDFVGGTYSGWQSGDAGHGHAHGICTWPWE